MKSQTFEGGIHGAPLVAANLDANQVILVGAGTATFDSSWKAHGSMSARFIAPSTGSQALLEFLEPVSASRRFRGYLAVVAPPSGYTDVMTMRAASNTMKIQVLPNRSLEVQNAAGVAIKTFPNVVPLTTETPLRVEAICTKGTSTTTGRIQVQIFAGDSTTPLGTYDSGAAVNTGTADMGIVRVGHMTTASTLQILWDDVACDAGDTWLGPASETFADFQRVAGAWVPRTPKTRIAGAWV